MVAPDFAGEVALRPMTYNTFTTVLQEPLKRTSEMATPW
jgi:hypothetical protein